MMRIFFIISLLILGTSLFSQEESFTIEVSNDTLLIGNYTIVKFTLKNIEGDFEAPDFYNFDILSGPNTSSMYSIVNGESTKESSYSYHLKPRKEGDLYIDPAYIFSKNDTLETIPLKIIVLPNPEEKIVQPKQMEENQFNFSFPQHDFDLFPRENRKRKEKTPKKKKKLKTRKL